MLVQQPNGKTAWIGNGSRNVSEEESLAAENDSDEGQERGNYAMEREPLGGYAGVGNMYGTGGSTCGFLMDNLSKVVIVGFVFLSALILILVRTRGETAALLCIDAAAKELDQIPYPDLNLKHISARVDKTVYPKVHTDKWVVIAALGAPPSQVQALATLGGWQLLAVGGSETPADWRVPGAIFLSLEQQAALGYRINTYLPYNSYRRKNVGYLFAVQHGAKKIYDADDRTSVLGEDLDLVFDVELRGQKSRHDPLLQYRSVVNRSVVNPFIHFGQGSVWPRGLPLEIVHQISPDISYAEVYPGNQIIQQGLANGLPDVDSIFYNTRRTEDEFIHINFDPQAPPVALPHGTMAPCNAFNTLFHSPGFWALMLPVSLSSKAADIVRGYWAQRLVWEIGGMLVVYPPTVQRVDTGEPSLFADEKDLHSHSGRLINFLLHWRSEKQSLCEKILHLSHAMGEEGFWGAQDVELTAAWLKDLVSVGWRQPRLLATELDKQAGDSTALAHKQFVPRAFPSVHLGVEDTSAMGIEVSELLKWRRYYGNMVLILECTWPLNHTVLAWRLLYGRLFKHVVVLSQENEASLGVEASNWWLSYELLPGIFKRYPNAMGFMVMKETVVFNYWHLASANKTKLWALNKVNAAWQVVGFNDTGSGWYLSKGNRNGVKKVVGRLPVEYRTNYRDTMDDEHFVVSTSDIYYIPRCYVPDFLVVLPIAVKARLHKELAIPLLFMALDSPKNFDSYALSKTRYLLESEVKEDPAMVYTPDWHAVYPWKANSEPELYRIIKAMSAGDPSLSEILE